MRRMIIFLLLILALTPALAEDYPAETIRPTGENEPDAITYLSSGTIRWIDSFTLDGRAFDWVGEFIRVQDEKQASFYSDDDAWPGGDASYAAIAAYGSLLSGTADPIFTHDLTTGEIALSAQTPVGTPVFGEVMSGFAAGKRVFLSFDTADGGHLLRIITSGTEVLDISLPWTCWYDSFHIGDTDDYLILIMDYGDPDEDYLGMSAELIDGTWKLSVINNGWEIIGVNDYAVSTDMNPNWLFGLHPWRDLAAIDWNALPMTLDDFAATLTKEGWLFAAGDVTLRETPDEAAPALADCSADTPLAVLEFVGDWAHVGLHLPDLEFAVGYVPVSELRSEPVSVIPGGEEHGWFYTMQVEDGVMTFVAIDETFSFAPLQVAAGFEKTARALYRSGGYSATPAHIEPTLYDYITSLPSFRRSIRDLFLTEDTLVLATADERFGDYGLYLIQDPAGESRTQVVELPGPFHFSREGWFWGVIEVVME